MQSVALKGFRLSIQQMRLWAWQRENPAYYIQCAMRLDGILDGAKFQQAFQQVVNRHAILRTRFQCLPGMEVPVQVVLDHIDIACPEMSLRGLSNSDQAVQLDAYFTTFRQQPFDLENGAPLQAMLLRVAERQAVLFLRLPALCGDSSTLKNFMSDLHQIYLSSLNGVDSIDEPLQYADVSAWQDGLLQEEDAKEQIAFWRKNDLSLLDTIRLPFEATTRAHTKGQNSFTPQQLTIPLAPGLQRLLEQTAQRYAVSLKALLLSGWQALLWRLTDASPCVLGVSCDGRHYEELGACLGLYSRVVPVSMSLSPSLSFQRLLPQVEAALREAIDAQSYFTWPSTSSQGHDQVSAFLPLGFEFESWQTLGHTDSLRCSLLRREGCFEPFALKLSVIQHEATLQLALHFDASRLSGTLVDQLTEILPAWFESLCSSVQTPIAAFPLLPASQQVNLLQATRGPRVAPPSALLHERFAAQAQRFPDELAAVCGQGQMSYQQLDRQVNRLAHLLGLHGVSTNEVVALCLPRSLEMLVGLLGVLKAGGAYAPLDPETPPARLCWQLADLSPRLLLTHSRLLSLFTEWRGPILCLDQIEWEKLLVSEPAVRVSPHDLAYIIYTSGSTGQPKGVMISHAAVSNYTQALCTQLEVEPGWHFATVSTLAADLGNTSIFCSLASGGCLHVLEYETLTSAATWQRYLEQWSLDVLKIVPSHLSALLSQAPERSVLPRKYLLLGGEELSISLLQRLAQEESSCKVLNHYGPTETTIGALTNMLGEASRAVEQIGAESVAIGRPLANVQAYILDRYQHLLPKGVVGELYLAGTGVAQGYRGRAEQTGERFVPHGWSEQPGERMYRTGDLGYLRANGQIVFMGRRDSQVKLRGYRIELGEIEATLQKHKNVRDCVVLLREDEPGKQQLVAYIVARQQPGPADGELRALLEERLPSYMLPTAFIGLRVLPLTPNGKVDRRQLPAPSMDEEERSIAYAAPRNPTEEILVGIWQDVLNVKPIGIHDHFTNLGGHSLLATQIISQVRIILQVEIPLRSIFEAPTVAGLAECVEQALRQNQSRQAPPLVRAPRDQALPLSFAQQRLWFLQQLEPHNSAYNVPIAVRLRGVLNVAMLQRSLQELLRRHENLRTTFPLRDSYPVQLIDPAFSCPLPLLDLSMLSSDQQAQAVRSLLYQEARRPFDLARGPVVRIRLLRLAEEEHVLAFTMHHIVSDGWSRGILVREVVALYNAFVVGRPSPLPELPIQYADFALWQRNWLQGGVLEAQIRYWREQLAGLSPLDLPTDRPRPAVQTSRGAHQELLLSSALHDGLRELSQREGVTLFMTVLAAFQVLMARYSGQSDIAVGTPIANRTYAEIEGLIGFFINTLVLRTDLSDNPTFQQLLARVRETCLGAYAHQDVPFEKLVEDLQPQRDLSRSPLFQVMLNVQQASPSPSDYSLHGLTLESLAPEAVTTKYDLTLTLADSAHGLECGIEYNTDLFEADTIARLLAHWQILLHAVVARPDVPVADLPLLTEEERHHLLVSWNQTTASYPMERCIHELFEAQVVSTPEALAIVCGDERLTYATLNHRANMLAHRLCSLGVGPDVLVGICLERSIEMVIGMLGILKAGGAYVPLDPAYPLDRLTLMLEDSQLPVLLTQPSLAEMLPSLDISVLFFSDTQKLEYGKDDEQLHHPCRAVKPAHLAYVIYTSGSTGRPKGIAISHRAVVNFLHSMSHTPGITAQDTVLAVTSLSFDIAALELLLPLTRGARVQIVSREVAMNGRELALQLATGDITVMQATPTMWRFLLDVGWSGDDRLKMLCGGEALTYDLAQRLRQKGASLWNMYGPTETTIWSTTGNVAAMTDRITIGWAIDNTQVYVLDRHLEPVPIGVPGELYIGGEGLARGYLRRPELSAAMFVPNPFSGNTGERMYHTGDLVRCLPDRTIEYLGRADQQVKVRGYRIELGEIEAVLQQLAEVKECVAVVREDKPGERELAVYIVCQSAEALTYTQLRSYLRKKLPEYMVPSSIVLLEALPLTPNRKIDRKALPKPSTLPAEGNEEAEEARNPVEEAIAGIWAQVLGRQQVGIYENFFEVGGHSLLAAQLISRLRSVLQVELPLRSLFEAPTIAGIAERTMQALRRGQGVAYPPFQPATREQELPLSFAQQRLWFLDQLEPGNAAYNIHHAVRLQGTLNMMALLKSLQAVIRRHESLRTTFQLRADQPVQIIANAESFSLPLLDLSLLSPQARELAARQLSQQEARASFDLSRGPLLHAWLVRLSLQEHVLLVNMHHIIADGWSMSIFVREVTSLYQAALSGQPAQLPALPIQYADFALWQRNWLQGAILDDQLAYWRQQLADLAPLELPTDYPRPAIQTFHGARRRLHLSAELSEELRQLGQHEGVTLFMTLLAAFQLLLARYSGQHDIAVGTDVANRTHAEIEGLIGFFVNTLVLRTNIAEATSFRELLRRVREVCLGAYAHQDVPFEKLVEALQPERNQSRSPFFQVFLSVQETSRSSQSLAEEKLALSGLIGENAVAKFDLNLTIIRAEQGLYCTMVYNTDLFTARFIDQLLHHFQTVLTNCLSDPEERLNHLSLLSEAERHQLLIGWNANVAPYPTHASMRALFEEQVKRTPERIAAVCHEEQLSYAHLNQRANQLAHQLIHLGLASDALVGLYLERSLDMLISILAVFKAGAAYVPLDPAYPRERLTFILDEAQVQVTLTTYDLSATLPASGTRLLYLEDCWQMPYPADHNPTLNHDFGEQLAYVIYTSGSTGRPKGVMVQQAGMLNHLFAKIDTLHLRENDVVAQTASHCFDISVWQFLAGLLIGGRVQIITDEIAHDPSYLLQEVIAGHISILELVPSLLPLLLDEIENNEYANQLQESLQWLIVTGEAASAQLCRRWLQSCPRTQLLNAYGPTECSDDVTHALIERLPSVQESSVPIGSPVGNIQVYLLDAWLEPVPIGVIGQIYVGGVGVGRGYLQDPERTAAVFLPDPYGQREGGRLYRTGDLGVYQFDGQIRYMGRIDEQVKVRGFRIELGEIKTVLLSHPQIGECEVIDWKVTKGDAHLAAYIVARGGEACPTSVALQDYLRGKLPHYMLPSFFIPLDALPLTPNGKVDRRALPAPAMAGFVADQKGIGARTPLEEMIQGIYQEILGRDHIGIHENFFELGGHSLLATRVISRLRAMLQIELPLRSLFEAPTVAGLAEVVEQALRQGQEIEQPPLQPTSRDQPLPLSFAQQRLWFLAQLEPESAAYHIPLAVRLLGPLDRLALLISLKEMVRRHESLRTTFQLQDDQPIQVIGRPESFQPVLVDLTGLPPALREQERERLQVQEARRLFDLSRGPLLRATLLHLDREETVVLLTMHHIVSDGWSMQVIVEEMRQLYTAFAAGEPSPLSELPLQYADYACWQRNWLHGEMLERQMSYWREQLRDLAPLELLTDYPRPAVQTDHGAHLNLLLPASLLQQLKALSQHESVTLFMTLVAAFQLLLARYSGQRDIAVGTDIANRTRAQTEGVVGFFVNTLVLRSQLTEGSTFQQLLQQVREVCLGAYAHQEVPFEKLVEALQPERDLSRSPLFQVFVSLQQQATRNSEPADWSGLRLQRLGAETAVAKFELSLALTESEQGLACVMEYNTDLFEERTIRQLLRHFQTLLEGIVRQPDVRLERLPLLSEEERQQVLLGSHCPASSEGAGSSLSELFEQQVTRTPDRIALCWEEQQMSYGELEARVSRLASQLRRLGVGPDVLVGLYLERSVALVESILAIWKAGGAYVPLDPSSPEERLALVMADSQLAVLITQRVLQASLPASHLTPLCLEDYWSEANLETGEQEGLSSQERTGQELAYVIYTSGSTGRPKGVMIQQDGMLNHLWAKIAALQLDEQDVVGQTASATFDISVWQMLAGLLCGAQVHILADEIAHDPRQLWQRMLSRGLTIVELVPSLLQVLLEDLEAGEKQEEELLALRWLLVTGEALPVALWHRWSAQFPEQPLLNAYGPTECSDDVTHACLQPPRSERQYRVPIGYPLRNLQVYVLDQQMEPVPLGVAGELYVGGIGVGRGYLHEAERTAAAFVPDPFGQQVGGRLYRTGDVGRYRADGQIEFLGRVDEQVKVRGYRIELGEIKTVLQGHEAVGACEVIDWEVRAGDRRLVAYVVGAMGRERQIPSAGELRAYLSGKLPEYMVPSFFVELDALPLTANGKLDRRALPAPGWSRSEEGEAFLAPRNPIERTLATIWAEVLHTSQPLGIRDNFFDLGGDSILGLQIIARANQQGIHVSIKQLFQHQTIEALSAVASSSSSIQAEQGLVQGVFPLTPIQHWFFSQQLSDPHHWNQARLLEVPPELESRSLEEAIGAWMSHHDALRLRFERGETGWQQVCAAPEEALPFSQVDLSALPEQERPSVASAAIAQAQASLNLSQGPLVRVMLLDLGGQPGNLLLIAIHHLAVDGVSWRILLEDLLHAYEQCCRGEPISLPPKTSSYQQWSRRLQAYAHTDALQQERAYWLAQAQKQTTLVPLDFPSQQQANTVASARQFSTALSAEQTRALLEEVVPACHAQMNEIVLLALLWSLRQWTASGSWRIELEGHGRESLFEEVDVSRTVGWFTALYPAHLHLPEGSTLLEGLAAVKQQYRGIPEHGIGYGLVRYLSGDEQERAWWQAMPQAQVIMNYQGHFDQALAPSGLFKPTYFSTGSAHSPRGQRTHVLSLNCAISRGQLHLSWEYSERLHERSTIERLAAQMQQGFQALLGEVSAAEVMPSAFSDVELSEAQLEQIFNEMDLGEEG